MYYQSDINVNGTSYVLRLLYYISKLMVQFLRDAGGTLPYFYQEIHMGAAAIIVVAS